MKNRGYTKGVTKLKNCKTCKKINGHKKATKTPHTVHGDMDVCNVCGAVTRK